MREKLGNELIKGSEEFDGGDTSNKDRSNFYIIWAIIFYFYEFHCDLTTLAFLIVKSIIPFYLVNQAN